tara:strand:+ start:258 stop:452 length:195 start_codon:yes stop_codon:yes gene_type:complete
LKLANFFKTKHRLNGWQSGRVNRQSADNLRAGLQACQPKIFFGVATTQNEAQPKILLFIIDHGD